jgi:putative transposase
MEAKMSAVTKLFHPFLALIASATEHELAKYLEYLKEENKILRARLPGKQVHTTPAERERLLKFGKPLGRAIEELITIVKPATFYRWCRDGVGRQKPKNPKGGQRKPREIRDLVIAIAKASGFGYTRIIGELRKLGIRRISRQTVRNILKEEGIEPGPDRSSDKWEHFLARHAETLWAADFFSVRTVTARGMREMYLLIFLCLETRELIVSPATEHPNSQWVCAQAQAFLDQTANRSEKKPTIVMHDRDTKFTSDFVKTLKAGGVRNSALPNASPNLNGRAERVILTLRSECLDKFIIFGKRHLDYLVSSFTEYYNLQRAHSSRDSLPPIRERPEDVAYLKMEQVDVKSYVGGLVKSFERKAA